MAFRFNKARAGLLENSAAQSGDGIKCFCNADHNIKRITSMNEYRRVICLFRCCFRNVSLPMIFIRPRSFAARRWDAGIIDGQREMQARMFHAEM